MSQNDLVTKSFVVALCH